MAWCAGVTANRSFREKIINDFSEWTAFSATRSGCPVKPRDVVYPLIRTPKYHSVLSGKEIQTAVKAFGVRPAILQCIML